VREPEPSECSESFASVSNQEPKVTSNVDNDMSWLDYVADASETKSEILDSADSIEAGQIGESKNAILNLFHPQDDALTKEQILGSEHSGENVVDDATSLQPVILLPYNECGSTAKEFNGTEENSQRKNVEPPPVASPVTQTHNLHLVVMWSKMALLALLICSMSLKLHLKLIKELVR
jgi:ubiquitin carboxyl-terminal hydrolase 16/45